jgi:DNA-nicking Smr family endonuclease
MPRDKRPTDLSSEDERLWEMVTSDAKPLGKKFVATKTPPAAKAVSEKSVSRPPAPPSPPATAAPAAPLSMGSYAGVDKNTARRFSRGEYPIDASLDLHFMTREKAHVALATFIETHYRQGSRCLLVVTGKGEKGEGVLRAELPRWLNLPELRPLVVAFAAARPHHGGGGAFYVLLRRRR